MFGQSVRIALEKTSAETQVTALSALATVAEAYDEAERNFPELLAEHRAARAGKPPKLSKSTKQTLSELEADQEILLAGLRAQYSKYLNPLEIISSLASALEADIPRSKAMLKYAPAEDLIILEARVNGKQRLLQALQACQAALRGESAA